MEIYKRILSCKDKNIKGLISKIIYKLTEEAWNDNCDDVSTIGCFPVKTSILDLESEGADYYNETPYWIGYIPLGMRVAYCMDIDFQGMYSDMGGYFVMNSDEYILEFARWLRGKKVVINNPYELINYVNEFLDIYFNVVKINQVNRKNLHILLVDKNGNLIPPLQEHNITDFKGVGAAMCTEYAALASNILSVFGFNTLFTKCQIIVL